MTTTLLLPENALAATDTAPFIALTISLRTSLSALSEDGGTANRQVRAEAARLGLDPSVATHWLYSGLSGHPDDEFDLDIALPIGSSAAVTPGSPFAIRNVPAFRCAQYTYTGSWSTLAEVYAALFQQFYADDHVYDGRVREIYRVVDLENTENCVTDIQIGIA